MRSVPLLSEHPRPVQFVLVFVLPVLFGALAGFFLGVSEPIYLVLSLLGILGGLGAGYDHVGARAGAKRGLIAGSLFGASILAAHELHGESAKAHLPEPAIILVAITTILAFGLAALGGRLRERSMRGGEGVASPAEEPPQPATPAPEPPEATAAIPAEPGRADPPAPAAPRTAPAGAVSLTSGSFDDYRGLGMSVTQAKRVIAYRDHDGFYSSVDDLDRVPGFSREFLAELKQKLQA